MQYDISRDSLISLFVRRVQLDGPRQALFVPRQGQYVAITWDEVADEVRAAAVALEGLGVKPGDRVIQVAENRFEWIVADLAILMARAVHVPVHASLTGTQIAYQIADSGAAVVLVSTADQARKLADQLPERRADLQVVMYDPLPDSESQATMMLAGFPPVRRLADLIQDVRSVSDAGTPRRAFPTEAIGRPATEAIQQRALEGTRPEDLATILYTSGTTGEPKGVMLTQRNLVHNTCVTMAAFSVSSDDLRLTWLPLSHIFARTCDLYAWIVAGNQLALAESRETILANCAQLSPTLMNGVPYFFDKLLRYLTEKGEADRPGSLQKLLGGRMRFINSGGAALPDHLATFFQSHDVLLVQGYGLTETSPVMTVNTDSVHKLGTVGRPIADVEVRIADDGEIITRGPHVMAGYWNKPQATSEAIRDGWFYTGDLGSLDSEGFLKITGRKKELIVLASGKNIAPVYLESLLTQEPLIAQALVIGDGRNYLTALIVPNFDLLKAELTSRGLQYTFPGEWLEKPLVRDLYAQRVAERLTVVSQPEQVRKFWLLERPFTLESGELTPTLKLRRGEIGKHYAAEIEAMYAGAVIQ